MSNSVLTSLDYIRDISISVKDYDIDIRELLNKAVNLNEQDTNLSDNRLDDNRLDDRLKLVRRSMGILSKLTNTSFDNKVACVILEFLLDYKFELEQNPILAKYLYLKLQQLIKNYNWANLKKMRAKFFNRININVDEPTKEVDDTHANEETTFIREAIDKYNKSIIETKARRAENAGKPKFEKNTIVGAKDSEGKWWAARVLEIFQYENKFMYFVEFLGFDSLHNECITKPYNIVHYNKARHPIKTQFYLRKDLQEEFNK